MKQSERGKSIRIATAKHSCTTTLAWRVPEAYHNKGPLHPSLPFFRLRSRKQLHAPRAGIAVVLECRDTRNEQERVHGPEHVGLGVFVAWVRVGPVVPDVGDDEHDGNLSLRQEKVLATFPVIGK